MILTKDLDTLEGEKGEILLESITSFFRDSKKIPAGSLGKSLKLCHENLKLLIRTSGALIYDRD